MAHFDANLRTPVLKFILPKEGELSIDFLKTSFEDYLSGLGAKFNSGPGGPVQIAAIERLGVRLKERCDDFESFLEESVLEEFFDDCKRVITEEINAARPGVGRSYGDTAFTKAVSIGFERLKEKALKEFVKNKKEGTEGYNLNGVTVDCLDQSVSASVDACIDMIEDQELQILLYEFRAMMYDFFEELGDISSSSQRDGLLAELESRRDAFFSHISDVEDDGLAKEVGSVVTILHLNLNVLIEVLAALELSEEASSEFVLVDDDAVAEGEATSLDEVASSFGIEKRTLLTRACINVKRQSAPELAAVFEGRPINASEVSRLCALVNAFSVCTEKFLNQFDDVPSILEALSNESSFDDIIKFFERLSIKDSDVLFKEWAVTSYIPLAIRYFTDIFEKKDENVKYITSIGLKKKDLIRILRGDKESVLGWLLLEDELIRDFLEKKVAHADVSSLVDAINKRCHCGVDYRSQEEVSARMDELTFSSDGLAVDDIDITVQDEESEEETHIALPPVAVVVDVADSADDDVLVEIDEEADEEAPAVDDIDEAVSVNEAYVKKVEDLFVKFADHVEYLAHPERIKKVQSPTAFGITLYELLNGFLDTPSEYTIPQVCYLIEMFTRYAEAYHFKAGDQEGHPGFLNLDSKYPATLDFYRELFTKSLREVDDFGPKNFDLKDIQAALDEAKVKLKFNQELLTRTQGDRVKVGADLQAQRSLHARYVEILAGLSTDDISRLQELETQIEEVELAVRELGEQVVLLEAEADTKRRQIDAFVAARQYAAIGTLPQEIEFLGTQIASLKNLNEVNAGTVIQLSKEADDLRSQVSEVARYQEALNAASEQIENLSATDVALGEEIDFLTTIVNELGEFLSNTNLQIQALRLSIQQALSSIIK